MTNRLQFTLPFDTDLDQFLAEKYPDVNDYRILSKSLDARKSNLGRSPKYHYVLEAIGKEESFSNFEEKFPQLTNTSSRPLIVGAGPAGLFCALRFAEYGIKTVIFERGDRANNRMKHISNYWRRGQLDADNNVCYGEGGAGLFSDGKLITRIKSPFVKYVMKRFVDFGAPAETAYISNPHLGSNKIRQLIGKMTGFLTEKGHEVHYNSKIDSLIFNDNNSRVIGVKLECGKEFFSDHVVLATGHSAKEIYYHLQDCNVAMESKGFAVGVRIEHSRSYIDKLQYGDFSDSELGAARYRLSWEDPRTKKGTFSFCMCPGGYVLSSGTEDKGIVVNGMSNYARNSRWSNSALVVSVSPGKDFAADDVLAGLKYQHIIERNAFDASVGLATGKEVPSQTIKDYLSNTLNDELPKTSCPSGLVKTNLSSILPEAVNVHLRNALNVFDKKMKGFVTDKGTLMAPETRTSAPVTIIRDRETLVSTSTKGLYPCGEGAGHAGGITSAAVDGIKVAMSILKSSYGLEE